MARTVSDMIEEYQNPEDPSFASEKFAHTFRVDYETKGKIELVAEHFGIRKSPFIAELVTAAINEAFEEIKDGLPDEVYNDFMEDVTEYHNQNQ